MREPNPTIYEITVEVNVENVMPALVPHVTTINNIMSEVGFNEGKLCVRAPLIKTTITSPLEFTVEEEKKVINLHLDVVNKQFPGCNPKLFSFLKKAKK